MTNDDLRPDVRHDILDRLTLALSFRRIGDAASHISEVLHENERLNDTVPTNWPLHLSADEFAAECFAMADYYESNVCQFCGETVPSPCLSAGEADACPNPKQ